MYECYRCQKPTEKYGICLPNSGWLCQWCSNFEWRQLQEKTSDAYTKKLTYQPPLPEYSHYCHHLDLNRVEWTPGCLSWHTYYGERKQRLCKPPPFSFLNYQN